MWHNINLMWGAKNPCFLIYGIVKSSQVDIFYCIFLRVDWKWDISHFGQSKWPFSAIFVLHFYHNSKKLEKLVWKFRPGRKWSLQCTTDVWLGQLSLRVSPHHDWQKEHDAMSDVKLEQHYTIFCQWLFVLSDSH